MTEPACPRCGAANRPGAIYIESIDPVWWYCTVCSYSWAVRKPKAPRNV